MLEADHQVELMKWVHRHKEPPMFDEDPMRPHDPDLEFVFAVPNGLFTHPQLAVEAKRQGLKSGVPDLLWPASRHGFRGLAIELKREKRGRVSENQRTWLAWLEEQGWLAVVARGYEEAIEILSGYQGWYGVPLTIPPD